MDPRSRYIVAALVPVALTLSSTLNTHRRGLDRRAFKPERQIANAQPAWKLG